MKTTISRIIAALAVAALSAGLLISCGPEIQPEGGGKEEGGSKTVAVTGVSLNKTSLSLVEGGSETLTATVAPNDATNKTVTWKSSDAGVATVDGNGAVTAVKAGSATITVTTADGNKTATCAVTVTAKTVSVTGVSLDRKELTMTEGDEVQLTATVEPADASDKSVEWASSDATVATVDANGKVTAVAAGAATITVKTKDGGKTAACAVTVNPKVIVVEGVTIEPSAIEIKEGETAQLKATVSPAEADQEVEWTTQNSQIATVDGNGLVTAVKPGTTRIIARSKTNIEQQGYCEVTVKQDQSLKGISLEVSEINLSVGESRTIGVIYTPEYAANKNVTWTSSEPETVSVNDGKVVALKEGMATITATSEEGGFTAECLVNVTKAKGPFVYSVYYWHILIDGQPDPLNGAFDGMISDPDDPDHPFENNFKSTYRIDYDGKDLYSVERYSYRDWLCVNRRPVVNLNNYKDYSWRLPEDLKGFSARNGVFALLGRVGQYDFEVIRATATGDVQIIKVQTPANNLYDVAVATAPDGSVYAVASLRDTFWDDCIYLYKISSDGTVTEKLVEKTRTSLPRIAVSDKGDVYIFTYYQNGGSQNGRLYKNGAFLQDIDEVEYNFQGALFCSGDHVYTAITDIVNKEMRVHKDGKKVLTLGKGKGAYLGYYTNRLWVTSDGDIYVSWGDDDDIEYLTKNDKVLYTSTEDSFWNFCVVE
jgi:uncharacterized protein YjdB